MGNGLARAALLLIAVSIQATTAHGLETLCADGLDDDADALVDCLDPDCAFDSACMQEVDREFRVVRLDDGRPYLNIYHLSLPEVPDIGDVANTAAATTNKCVGSPGPPAGPSLGDGILNADDLLCSFWGGQGFMEIGHQIRHVCLTESRRAERLSASGVVFTGEWTAALGPPEGYSLQVGDVEDPTAEHVNPVTIRGWCDPSWPGQVIGEDKCVPQRRYLHVPYDVLYRTVDEILCGFGPPNGDWDDVVINQTLQPGSDGQPDTCTGGIFDSSYRGAIMSILYFDNVKDGSLPLSGGLITTDNVIVSRVANVDPFGKLRFSGDNFPIEKGHSYRVDVPRAQQDRLWHPPQEGVNCITTPPDAWLYLTKHADRSITASWEERESPSEHGLHAQDLDTLPSSARDVLACGLPPGPASIPLVDPSGAGRDRAYVLTSRRGATEWLGADSFGVDRPATTPVGCP